jgi:hypothetical protein
LQEYWSQVCKRTGKDPDHSVPLKKLAISDLRVPIFVIANLRLPVADLGLLIPYQAFANSPDHYTEIANRQSQISNNHKFQITNFKSQIVNRTAFLVLFRAQATPRQP